MSEENTVGETDTQALMRNYTRRIREIRDKIRDDRLAGEAALRRLLPIAQGCTGQSDRVARLLLGLYNGHRFRFDLSNLRCLDYEIQEDCLAVMRMDMNAFQEVHRYFENGGKLFEKLAEDLGNA